MTSDISPVEFQLYPRGIHIDMCFAQMFPVQASGAVHVVPQTARGCETEDP